MPEPTAVRRFRILGTTDEIHTCDLCGRTDLKSTVELDEFDADGNRLTDEPLHFGTTCASKATRWPAKRIRDEIRAIERERAEAERKRWRDEHAARFAGWAEFLDARCPEHAGNVFLQCRALGGFKAARAEFKAQGAA
jgi:hypothetical protein